MPVYNTDPQLLERSIESCLHQSCLADYEVVIVNNGSTNLKTCQILDGYGTNAKVRILECPQQENKRNISVALNFGIKNIINPFIARMDSDDIMMRDRLKTQLEYMQDNPNIAVLGSQIKTLFAGQVSQLPLLITPQNAITAKWNWFISHPSVMIRAAVFEEVGLYDEDTIVQPEDLELWFRILQKGLRMENLPEVLLSYNDHQKGLSIVDSKDPEWDQNIEKIRYKFRRDRASVGDFLDISSRMR